MPINPSIPLQVQGIDPNGFTNALAAGMKMREVQQAGDRLNLAENRLARKDEAATADKNALANYLSGPRTPEADKAFAGVSPEGYLKTRKSLDEADNNAAQAKLHQLAWAKANHGLLEQGAAAILSNPTPQNANAVLDSLEAQGGDMSHARGQLRTSPPEQIANLAKGWGMTAQQFGEMERKQAEAAKPRTHWDSYNARLVTEPSAGAGPEAAVQSPPARPGTVVPGGELPPPEDIDAAVLHREGQGPVPAGNVDYEGLSDEGLAELQRTSTFQKGQKPGAPQPGAPQPGAPMPSTPPAPVDAPQTPPPLGGGPPRSPSEAAQRAAQQREARALESDRLAGERQDKGFAHAEKMAEDARAAKAAAAEAKRAGPGGQPKLTEDQGKSAGYSNRATAAVARLPKGYQPGVGDRIKRSVGGLIGAPNALLSDEGQRYNQAMDDAIDAVVRGESGANTPEPEIERAKERYKIQIEDTDANIAQKRASLDTAIQGLRMRAGPAANLPKIPATPHPDTSPALPKPVKTFDSLPMPSELPGARMQFPDGFIRRSNGRDWVRE